MRALDPRLVQHLKPAAPSLAGLVAASVLGTLVLIAQTFAVAHLLVVLTAGDLDRLPAAAGLTAAAIAFRAVVTFVGDVCAARASATVSGRLRHRLTQAALELPAEEAGGQRTGELALLVTRGVPTIEPYLTRYLPALLLAVVLPPLALATLYTQDLMAAAIVTVTLPLVPVFAVLVGLATRDRADRQWQALSALAGHFVDVMKGLPTLVAHGRARAQSDSIRRVTDQHRRATLSTLKLAFASSAVLELVATLSVALVAVVVGLRLATGSLDLMTALVVLLLAPEAYWPMRRVGAEFHAAAEGSATFDAADEVLRGLCTSKPGVVVDHPWSGVVASGLRLTYPGRSTAALDLAGSVHLPPRSLVAVVGPSGSGKSTLLAALAGEVTCQQGSISSPALRLDGDTVAGWREQVSWLPQRPWLESGSVRDNLAVARCDAADVELWDALTEVGLREVVAARAGGLDAPVGEDGDRFSAGQRARLALARAVIAGRPLVLVDEPSAHLDAGSEEIIASTLTRLASRSTVVVVTHSPRLQAAADRVIRLAPPDGVPMPPRPSRPSRPSRAVGTASGRTAVAVPGDRAVPSPPGPRGRTGARGWAAASVLGILASASGVALTVTSGWLVARASQHPPVLYLTIAIVGVRAFGLGRPLLRYGERLLGHDSALRLLAERRAQVYDTIVPLTPGALGRRRGDVLTTVVDDVDALLDDRLRVRTPLFGVVGVGVLGILFSGALLAPAGAAVLGLVVGTLAAAAAVRWSVSRAERDLVRWRALVSARVVQAVEGGRNLVLWQATTRATRSVDEAGAWLDAARRRSQTVVAAGRAAVTCLVSVGVWAMAVLAAPAVASARLSAPMAVALVLLPLALLEVLVAAPDAGGTSVRTRDAQRRLRSLQGLVPAVSDPSPPGDVPTEVDRLETRGLACGWNRDDPVFTGLDLDVPAGRRIAVVGASGTGKSTLAATLVRFIDPGRGTIRVGGTPLQTLPLGAVHRVVGLVEDDPYVFSSSVLENIRLAKPGADRGQVESALRSVSLGAWLDALPEGLDTLVGDGNDAVSGGERARLGLARAVLADAAVLVLDEPTAHLDADTARLVAADVLTASSGRAVVWITHDSVGLDAMDAVVDLTPHAAASDRTPAMPPPLSSALVRS